MQTRMAGSYERSISGGRFADANVFDSEMRDTKGGAAFVVLTMTGFDQICSARATRQAQLRADNGLRDVLC